MLNTEEFAEAPVSIDAQLLCREVSFNWDDPCHFLGNERLVARDDQFEDVVVEREPGSIGSCRSLIVVVRTGLHLDYFDAEPSKPISGNCDVRVPGLGRDRLRGTVWQGGQPLPSTGAEVEHRVGAARKSVDDIGEFPRERLRLHAIAEPREVPPTDGMRLSLLKQLGKRVHATKACTTSVPLAIEGPPYPNSRGSSASGRTRTGCGRPSSSRATTSCSRRGTSRPQAARPRRPRRPTTGCADPPRTHATGSAAPEGT